MKSAVAVSAALLFGGCAAETDEPEPRDCADGERPFGLDITLAGLDEDRTYLFGIEAEGGSALIARTPEVSNTFVEAPLPGQAILMVVLFDDTLRVIVENDDGRHTGPVEATVRVFAQGEELVAKDFDPAYEMLDTGDGCGDFVAALDSLVVPAVP